MLPGPGAPILVIQASSVRRHALENTPTLPVVAPVRVPEAGREAQVDVLARVCADDLIGAFGLGGLGPGAARFLLRLLSSVPARRLARQIATYDAVVGEAGLPAGGEWALAQMAREVEVEGADWVPRGGPLLVVSNHPGLADAVALFSAMPRDDLRVIAAKRPFLSALPNTSKTLITVSENSNGRSTAVRTAARHLRAGGAGNTFPRGGVEPHPGGAPGATEALADWSGSVDLFARLVPGLTVVPAVGGGAVSGAGPPPPPPFAAAPPASRRWLSPTPQILVPALRDVTPRVESGPPLRAAEEQKI